MIFLMEREIKLETDNLASQIKYLAALDGFTVTKVKELKTVAVKVLIFLEQLTTKVILLFKMVILLKTISWATVKIMRNLIILEH